MRVHSCRADALRRSFALGLLTIIALSGSDAWAQPKMPPAPPAPGQGPSAFPPPGAPGGPGGPVPGGPPPGVSGAPGAAPPSGMPELPGGPSRAQAAPPGPTVTIQVPVSTAMSLVHVGSSDSFAITPEGREAATLLLSALEGQDAAKARDEAKQASAVYDKIIPRENYGGEYSALQWFADYFAADAKDKPKFLEDPQVKVFFEVFGGNDYAVVKEYLLRKYRIRDVGDEETKAGQDRKIWLEDTMLFNNPRRESWEKTSEFMKLLKLKPGDKIADVGSGPGYFSFRFAKMVGPEGQVYAIDMVDKHLRYVDDAKAKMGVTNVSTIETDGTTIGLADPDKKVDAVWLCSLYHNMYAMATEPQRSAFVNSIRDAMKDDARLYLVDNGLVEPGILPYHGPYVAKELLIAQLLNFGFDLVEEHQPIPQRYMLIFKKKKPGDTAQHK
jgi:SAM-dependent methyltransferase